MTELPSGWGYFTLGQIGGLSGGKTPSKSNSNFWERGTIPWVSPKDMKQFEITTSIDKISETALSHASMELYPADTVLIVTRSGILDHTFPVAIAKVPVTVNQDVKVIRPRPDIDSKFLAYNLRCHGQKILETCSKAGTTVTSIRTSLLEDFDLPIAPIQEQKRIVQKLDVLLKRVEVCNEGLNSVMELLAQFRHAVLISAVRGTLLNGKKGTENWTFERADDVCEKVQSGGTPSEGFTGSGIPFLKVYNIAAQQIAFDYKPQYVDRKIHDKALAKSKVYPGDVVMNIVGPPLGKIAIVPATHAEWNVNQAISLFRPSKKICTEWIYYVLCSGENIKKILPETKGSAGQINISLTQCRDFMFPVPPMREQTAIVKHIKELFAFADSVAQRVKDAQMRTESLPRSILNLAFQGKLTAQLDTDSGADSLIAAFESTTKSQEKIRSDLKKANRENLKMTKTASTKVAVEQLITQMPIQFTFDELRHNFSGDYEKLKELVFALITENPPVLTQFFDKKKKQMLFSKDVA